MSMRPTSQRILPLINLGAQRRAEHEHNSDDDFTLSHLTSASIGQFFDLTKEEAEEIEGVCPITLERMEAGLIFGLYKERNNNKLWSEQYTFYNGDALWKSVKVAPIDPVTNKPIRKFDWLELRNKYSTKNETPDLPDELFSWPRGVMSDLFIKKAVDEVLQNGNGTGWEHSIHGPIADWDVRLVTNMRAMFQNATAFNGDLSKWNVGNVTDMRYMFQNATAFNGDLSNWNVGNVTDMRYMFYAAAAFNGDLSKWDVGNVKDTREMFAGATAFNGDLSKWKVGNVTNMSRMFAGATAFSGDLSGWNLENEDTENTFGDKRKRAREQYADL